jgi:hypothetical protein
MMLAGVPQVIVGVVRVPVMVTVAAAVTDPAEFVAVKV